MIETYIFLTQQREAYNSYVADNIIPHDIAYTTERYWDIGNVARRSLMSQSEFRNAYHKHPVTVTQAWPLFTYKR